MSPSRTAPLNPITRSDLETALDDLNSNQRSTDFQRIAVRLAKEKNPSLVASEISKDGGEDAFLLGKLPDGTLLSVAASLTATIGKIRSDLKAIKKRKPDIKTLWFYTLRPVSTQKIDPWRTEIQRDYGVELQVITREEVIGRLLDPRFAYLAYHHLGFPHPVMDEVRKVRDLLAAGCDQRLQRWRTMRLAGKVHAVAREYVLDDGESVPSGSPVASEIAGALLDGGLFALWGEGGIGKSVALEQLAQAYSNGPTRPIPLLISAPAWSRSDRDLPAFLGSLFLGKPEQFRSGLTQLLQSGQVGVFINGWNEVAPEARASVADRLGAILHSAPGCPIVVATRTTADLEGSVPIAHYRLQPLSTAARAELADQVAAESVAAIEAVGNGDRGVDTLSRLPLFLIPMAQALGRGEAVPRTRTGLLEAALVAMERSPDHATVWKLPGRQALARLALGRIASELSIRGTTEASRAEAQGWIEQHVPGTDVRATQLLEDLVQHHVLERDGLDTVRFQHQYFQDWLCAQHLSTQSDRPDTLNLQIAQWLNNRRLGIAWAMLTEVLAESANPSTARELADRLFKVALDVDLQLAAEWVPTLKGRLPAPLVQELVKRLRVQFDHGGSARRLAIRAVFASRLPDFAEPIWRLLESEDATQRNEVDNLREQIPVEVLGPHWRTRVLQWRIERRIEFVTRHATVAGDSDSLALQRYFALRDPSELVRAHCIQEIAFNDRAAGDQLFAAASDECRAELLELGAWDAFSPPTVTPWLATLEKESHYPVTTPRGEQALAYLAEHFPDKAIATHREKLQHSVFGAPNYDQSFQFLAEYDRAWTADWILGQLVAGKRVPMNSVQVLQERMDSKTLLPVLDQVLSAASDDTHARERSLGLLISVGNPDVVSRCISEWAQLHPKFQAGAFKPDASIQRQLMEIETALSNAPVAPLASALLAADSEIQTAAAISSVGRMVASAVTRPNEEEAEAGMPADLLTLIDRLVARVSSLDDLNGHLNATLVEVIQRAGDSSLRPQLDQLFNADRTRRIASVGSTANVPIGIRVFAGQKLMAAVRKLAGRDAIAALLPMLEKDPFDLAAAQELVDELDERAGRTSTRHSSQIDWPQVTELQQNLVAEPMSPEAQQVLAAFDQRLAHMGTGGDVSDIQARAVLEALRAQIVGYVREQPLLAVPLNFNSIYTLVQWSATFISRGVQIPARWPEHMLEWLASTDARQRLPQDDLARLVIGCLIAFLFSDDAALAARHIRQLCTRVSTPVFAENLLIPIAISGIADQISLLTELMPRNVLDQHWWAWREALRYLSPNSRIQLVQTVLSSGVPAGLRDVILKRHEPDLSAMLAECVEASESLRSSIEALVNGGDPQTQQFALSLLSNVGARPAAVDSLLRFARAHPGLRVRIGHLLVDTRWQRPEGGRWRSIAVPNAATYVREKLLQLTQDDDVALRDWAATVLSDVDASVDGEFPPAEPRHPDLSSNIRWPIVP
jgi:hypothetical protein